MIPRKGSCGGIREGAGSCCLDLEYMSWSQAPPVMASRAKVTDQKDEASLG